VELFNAIWQQVSANWVALLAALISIASAFYANNQRRRELRIAWNREVVDWAKQAIAVLAEAEAYCVATTTLGVASDEKRIELQARLSAMVDQGRLFFENTDGLRASVLDPVVSMYNLTGADLSGMSLTDIVRHTRTHRRAFWRRVQDVVDPRWVRAVVQARDVEPGTSEAYYLDGLIAPGLEQERR
jgi:hypothetical protein